MDFTGRIKIMGIQVYYEYHRSNTSSPRYTFLLIHGFLANTFSFRKLVPNLMEQDDVYAIDLIGFGKSEKACPFRYSYENYGAMITQFITELGLKNVILVGHSMGGQIVLQTALRNSDMITALVLVSSSGYLQKAHWLAIVASHLPFASLGVTWWMKRYRVKDILKKTFYNDKLIDDQMIRAYSDPILEKGFCDTLLGLLRHREGDMSPEDLRRVHHDCLLIWGEEDEIVPLRKGVRLRQDLANSTLISLPEAGHQVIEEKPTEVTTSIQSWIEKHSHRWNKV
ncbi:alpha/beta fold hydrolase [Ammoniphilus sp. CFH 90114]|uniref:alpha/beta fold hydrolase n=1 Tax=Ammoniphilus sp. CFH 90114 TaxID=2493665 RepID=UPI00100DAA34|nr:alpha/beta hydrolase [Ammoniphilus sp. CFH 90114]RXT14854.1 alpha/beta hydrolase [Ammoniphilus sp. CFH 90114]